MLRSQLSEIRRTARLNGRSGHILILAFIVMTAINIVQFPFIDRETRHNYSALHSYRSADVVEVAIASDNAARERIAPYYFLGRLYPNADVIIPYAKQPNELSLVSFGRVRHVERLRYNPRKLVTLGELDSHMVDFKKAVNLRGNALEKVNSIFGIAVSPHPSGTFVAAHGEDGRYIFVDSNLLDAKKKRTLGLAE